MGERKTHTWVVFSVGLAGLAVAAFSSSAGLVRAGLVVLGLVVMLLAFRGNPSSTEPSLEAPAADGGKPQLKDLGTGVERILRLAEEQAADYRAKAEREAQQIVATAHARADEIAKGTDRAS